MQTHTHTYPMSCVLSSAAASRLRSAQRILAGLGSYRGDRSVGQALRVNPKTVTRWRAGRHAPTPRHWQQLLALRALILWARSPLARNASVGFGQAILRSNPSLHIAAE